MDMAVALRLHPHDDAVGFGVEGFLSRGDFTYRSPETGRLRTYRRDYEDSGHRYRAKGACYGEVCCVLCK